MLACQICEGYRTRGSVREATVMQDTTLLIKHVFMCGEHAEVFGLGKVTLDLRALHLTSEGTNA